MHGILTNPVALLLVQTIIIIACSRLVGLMARRVGQPVVVAEILTGVLLGPSFLGLIWPSGFGALFPVSSLPMLGLLSQFGLVCFMFLVGLELDPRLLVGRKHASVLISHTSIIVPFALGAVLARYLAPQFMTAGTDLTAFTLFMGVAMSITAFPVLARILTERRLMRSKLGALTIACAAVDDVTAWCLLAFVVSVVRVQGYGAAAITTGLAIVFILVMIFAVRPFLARLGARAVGPEGPSQNVIALALLMVLTSSLVTEAIGIHALFGAFICGAIVPRERGLAQAFAAKLEDFVVVLLLPLFFAYSGLRTRIGLLDTGTDWLVCGGIVLVACAGKFGGSAIAARFTGLSWRESSAIGILMNTRGLMELVALNIGLDLGVISPLLFTMMVLMALVTTVATSPLLAIFYPQSEVEKELAEPEAPLAESYTALLCVADVRTGPPLLDIGTRIAGPGARLLGLHLQRPPERTSSYATGADTPPPDDILAPMVARAAAVHAPLGVISFASTTPARDICGVATAKRADLVLLGWRRPLFGEAALSGTVSTVLASSPGDVGVLIDRGLTQLRCVLVAYQGGPQDRVSLRIAERLARGGTPVTLLSVHPPGVAAPELPAEARELGASPNVSIRLLHQHKDPAEAVISAVNGVHDLLIVAAGPEWRLEARLFAWLPEPILARCPVSILIVRGHDAEAPAPAWRPALLAGLAPASRST